MSRLGRRFLYDRDIFMTVAYLAVILALPQGAFACMLGCPLSPRRKPRACRLRGQGLSSGACLISLFDHLLQGFADERHILLEGPVNFRRGGEIPAARHLFQIRGGSKSV
jgi:hypothetical protein